MYLGPSSFPAEDLLFLPRVASVGILVTFEGSLQVPPLTKLSLITDLARSHFSFLRSGMTFWAFLMTLTTYSFGLSFTHTHTHVLNIYTHMCVYPLLLIINSDKIEPTNIWAVAYSIFKRLFPRGSFHISHSYFLQCLIIIIISNLNLSHCVCYDLSGVTEELFSFSMNLKGHY